MTTTEHAPAPEAQPAAAPPRPASKFIITLLSTITDWRHEFTFDDAEHAKQFGLGAMGMTVPVIIRSTELRYTNGRENGFDTAFQGAFDAHNADLKPGRSW